MTTKEEEMHLVLIVWWLFLGAVMAQETPLLPFDSETYYSGGGGDIDSTLEQQALELWTRSGRAAVADDEPDFWYDEARREAVRRAIESAQERVANPKALDLDEETLRNVERAVSK